jgi:hypothetical protein
MGTQQQNLKAAQNTYHMPELDDAYKNKETSWSLFNGGFGVCELQQAQRIIGL